MKEDIKILFAPILVVEDNPDHARLIMKTLINSGNLMNEVIHVKNGEDAIDFLKKSGKFSDSLHILPMLVLLDIKLPLKDGFQVLEIIKSDEKLKKIPVVMLTTTSTTDDISKAIRLGANDFIVKPVKFAEFTEKVAKLGYYWGAVSDVKKIFL